MLCVYVCYTYWLKLLCSPAILISNYYSSIYRDADNNNQMFRREVSVFLISMENDTVKITLHNATSTRQYYTSL